MVELERFSVSEAHLRLEIELSTVTFGDQESWSALAILLQIVRAY